MNKNIMALGLIISFAYTATPYGGQLINQHCETLEPHAKIVDIDDFTLSDITCIGSGIYSPLNGFMNQEDYNSVVQSMHLSSGIVWPIPVTYATSEAYSLGEKINFSYKGNLVGELDISDIYTPNKTAEVQAIYGTTDENHPGVAFTLSRPQTYLGGRITVNLELIRSLLPFNEHLLFPQETRALFQRNNWQTIASFQTRNPLHRSHEHLLKVALHLTQGLMLSPLVGHTKGDDIPADVRMATYKATIQHYFPKGAIELVTYPAAMRYAGPKEAILHAISRQNYGCTHFIVGRDHAGVGSFYHPLAAQRLFDELPNPNLTIQILKFENAFYCIKTKEMATSRTCPEGAETIQLSGTEVRRRLKAGESLPEEMTRPEVAEILRQHYMQGL